jgi:four helix bundle protein
MIWRQLEVWKRSHELVKDIYKIARNLPTEEKYGLISQICRAAVSIAANIVEGNARKTIKDYIRFLYNARGSLEELRYLLFLIKELGYSVEKYDEVDSKCIVVSRMLNRLIKSLSECDGVND